MRSKLIERERVLSQSWWHFTLFSGTSSISLKDFLRGAASWITTGQVFWPCHWGWGEGEGTAMSIAPIFAGWDRGCNGICGQLLKKENIRPSKSPYGSPLIFLKEKEKNLRGFVDYRAINRITKRNNTLLPYSDGMFDRLGYASMFSKLDLKTGFNHISVER